MTVTFFGHRDAPQEVKAVLETVLSDLIEHHAAERFYVGSQGRFDRIVSKTLIILKNRYPHIDCAIVLAYMPDEKLHEEIDTIVPERIELTHPKYAISKRNQWMLEQSDIVITYVTHTVGGAAKFKELAVKKGKSIIELSDFM